MLRFCYDLPVTKRPFWSNTPGVHRDKVKETPLFEHFQNSWMLQWHCRGQGFDPPRLHQFHLSLHDTLFLYSIWYCCFHGRILVHESLPEAFFRAKNFLFSSSINICVLPGKVYNTRTLSIRLPRSAARTRKSNDGAWNPDRKFRIAVLNKKLGKPNSRMAICADPKFLYEREMAYVHGVHDTSSCLGDRCLNSFIFEWRSLLNQAGSA